MVQVRVVSYNLLSSSLARSDHFTTYPPPHLLAENRLPIILEKLEYQRTKAIGGASSNSSNNNTPKTIFCLQEISREWAGELHTYFANHGYQLVTGLYGRYFNGYMGVGIAYPMNEYETIAVDIKRVSDTKPYLEQEEDSDEDDEETSSSKKDNSYWPKSKPKTKDNNGNNKGPSLLGKLLNVPKTLVSSFLTPLLNNLPLLPRSTTQASDSAKDTDPWDYSQYRQNILVSVCLKPKQEPTQSTTQSTPFWVHCYHMPCAFWSASVMTMHVEMVLNYVQNILPYSTKDDNTTTNNKKKQRNIPFILTGDWNIKPQDTIYDRMISGKPLKGDDPGIPPSTVTYETTTNTIPTDNDESVTETITTPKRMEWILKDTTFQPMTSAYRQMSSDQNTEPEFTNWARVKEDDPFIDTLDYIFLSHNSGEKDGNKNNSGCDWKIISVEELKTKETGNGPYPNLDPTVNEPSDHVLIAADLEL